MHRKGIALLLVLSLLFPVSVVNAQTTPDNPIYIVQSGDTLGVIALRFGVSVTDLINANNISDPNQIAIGTQLIIPGLKDVSGYLVTQTVPIGESLYSLSLRYQVSTDLLVRLNRITSANEIYAGTNLVIPQVLEEAQLKARAALAPGESLLEAAVLQNENPWKLSEVNRFQGNWDALPGETIYSPASDDNTEISSISPLIKQIVVDPLPLVQGETTSIRVTTNQPLDLTGSLGSYTLNFFQTGENEYAALQGISAVEETGLFSLVLHGAQAEDQALDFQQMLLLEPGYFTEDPPLEVDPATIDPAITQPEDEQINQVTQAATTTRYWTTTFQYPTDEPCTRSLFGNRRVYNDSYHSYHSGVDFGVCADNLNIYAPAPGVVVFTGQLNVRGNATIVDHGWGVYTGYWHQEEILVKVGDHVEQGQLIGIIGKTGRVTGPHLHWELRVNSVPVNPLTWIDKTFP